MYDLDSIPQKSNIKRTRSGAVSALTNQTPASSTATTTTTKQNLDISKEAIDLLDIIQSTTTSQNEKFLIQWQQSTATQNASKLNGNKHVERKIVDYFSSLQQFTNDEYTEPGFLTQACQQNQLKVELLPDDEPDIKKKKISSTLKNEKETKKKLLSNLLNEFTEFNRFFSDDQIAPNEQKEPSPSPPVPPPLSPKNNIKLESQPSAKQSSPPLSFNPTKLNTETTQRTSTPRGKHILSLENKENGQTPDKISDHSLVIALSQFEQTSPKKEPQKRSFNFQQKPSTTKTTSQTPDKSFTRYKSDPIRTHNTVPAKTSLNKQFTSSQTIRNVNVGDEDDDDDLLLINDNLLKIIDSKVIDKPNDSLARLMPRKAPIGQQASTLAATAQQQPKLIQVPTKTTLKIERNQLTDNFSSVKPQQQSAQSKNFYGTTINTTKPTTANTTTNTTTSYNQTTAERKYTQDEIEKKRQQALLKLRQKTFSK